MGWSCEECLNRFDQLAQSTFEKRESRFNAIRILQRLALSYLQDAQYSSQSIEQAFTSSLGQQLPMFNPLSSDNKVAVTTTTAKDPRTCLLTNYNGGLRPKDLGMFQSSVNG